MNELKEIKRIKGMKNNAPNIMWGEKFEKLPIHKQAERAKRVASAMNHAADILQTERNKLLVTCQEQNTHIAHITEQYAKQGELFHSQIQIENAKQQELNQLLVEKTGMITKLKAEVKRLGGDINRLGD